MMYRIVISACILFLSQSLCATHNRAGEISFIQLDELTIRMTITTYTKTSSTSADRDSLAVFWGDGTTEFVMRTNGNGQELANDVKLNTYVADHTYPGINTYTISFMDPNRVENILNVNPPYSIDVPFYLETTFTFLNTQFQGINNSPVLLQAPLDFACVNQPFIHNPNAYDADGDSIAYELVVPLQTEGNPVPDYIFPDQIAPGPNNMISLDEKTGDFVWDSPKIQGEYNIAIRIKEYRNGILISSMIRDMQILVKQCDSQPPTIESVEEVCIVAGNFLDIEVEINDPDQGDLVQWTATGGPFQQSPNTAELSFDSTFNAVAFSTQLQWQTDCSHIRDQPYQVVIRAVDNSEGSTGLSTLKTIRIKVVGPPPLGLTAQSLDNAIRLEWDYPYACINPSDFFQGFSVWRKELSNPFVLDTCVNGLEGKGYEKIEFNTSANDGSQYFFLDEDISNDKAYCYRILAEFALLSSTGNPFNRIESLSSEEACLQLSRDLPLLTKASVITTDLNNGTIEIEWTKPLSSDFDTLLNPGPYRYVLKGGTNALNLAELPGAVFTQPFFSSPIDTMYIHQGINTLEEQFIYQLDFYTGSQSELYGSTQTASSIYLNAEPKDQRVELNWVFDTPWQNYSFEVNRFNPTTSTFDSIGTSITPSYIDTDLINGEEYCYQILAFGSYGIDNTPTTILNLSQENCATPIDLEPPCPPNLSVSSLCEKLSNIISPEDLVNSLQWINPDNDCNLSEDISGYNIYYGTDDDQFELIGTNMQVENLGFEHLVEEGQLGCYAVTAFDTNSNESPLSNVICIETCPQYELPNTFTPNADGFNDLFKPIKNIFVSSIDFKVYNRWGNLVYETTDPIINWDGNNLNQKPLADGTYYYTCRIYENSQGVEREATEALSGFIHLLRG